MVAGGVPVEERFFFTLLDLRRFQASDLEWIFSDWIQVVTLPLRCRRVAPASLRIARGTGV